MSFVYILLPDNKKINWTLHGVWNTDRGANIFDKITSPPNKDIERELRVEYEIHTSYYIQSLKQKRPTNFLQALRSDSFKQEIVNVLSNGYSDPSLSCILGDKVLFLTKGESCFSFRQADVVIVRLEEINMKCSH
jgi:hypothetical protein